ncbi:MAG: JAB domain-containing protein [Ferruginibacter sp.]
MQNNIQTLFTVSEVELFYRNKIKPNDRIHLKGVAHAYDILLSAWDMNKIDLIEQFYILLLDRNHTCLALSHISTGGVSSCIVDPKIVFATALKAKASSIILAHNHPSGNTQPSKADINLTEKLKSGGELLDINVVDHIIVTPTKYYSFAEEYVPF